MRLKKIVSIAFFLIVALVVAVYVILSIYDFNSLKPKISQAVKDATGRELRINGEIDVDIGLTPAIVVEDISFQNAPWGSRPEMIRVSRFEAQVALLPLLTGKIRVKRLIFIEPDILVETDNSGRSNLDIRHKESVETSEPEKDGSTEGMRLPHLTFDQVRFDNGRLTYRDNGAERDYSVDLESLTVSAETVDGPVELKLKGAYNGEPFQVAGSLGSLLELVDPDRPWPLRLKIKAVNTNVTLEGTIRDIMTGRGIEIKVTADGQSIPHIARLVDIRDIPELGPFKAEVMVTAPEKKLAIKGLDINIGTDEIVSIRLSGAVNDPIGMRGMDLEFSVRGNDLKNLEGPLRRKLPFHGPFEISGRVSDSGVKSYKISDLKIAVVESDVGGSGEVTLSKNRPRLRADLSAKRLDLRSLAFNKGSGSTAGEKAEAAKSRGRLFSDDPLPLDILKQADVDIRLRADRVLLSNILLKDLSIIALLDNGHLTIKDIKSVMGEGTLRGRLDLRPHAKGTIMKTAFKIEQLEIGRMLKGLGKKDIAEGRIDLDVDLNSRGGSVAELMAGLNGKVVLITGKGRINNRHTNLLGGDLGSGLFRLLNPMKKETEYTEVNCLVSRFDIKEGLADCTALVFDTDLMSVVGDGNIDLRTEELDFSIKPSPKKGLGVNSVGKISISLGELAKPLKLSGTLSNPSLVLDPAKTAIALGKAIGGIALFGPIGIVAALAGGSSGGENPCLCAIEAAKKGVKVSDDKKVKNRNSVAEENTESVAQGVEDAVKGIGDAFKKLFGN